MTKFNVGDKVEFIQNYGSYEIGDVVEVIGIWSNKKGVFFKGNKGNGNVYAQRLKLFTPKQTKNQRITALENELAELLPLKEEVAELKLIVHELRDTKVVPSTNKEDSPFKIGDSIKVVANTTDWGDKNKSGYHVGGQGVVIIGAVGQVMKVDKDFVTAEFSQTNVFGNEKTHERKLRFDEIELISVDEYIIEFEGDKYRKVEREAQLGDLVVFDSMTRPLGTDHNGPYIVNKQTSHGLGHHDGLTTSDVNFLIYHYGRTPENVDVYELIVEDKPLSPNEKRAQIIEDAKKFVEDCKGFTGLITNRKGYRAGTFKMICDAEFVVNPEKRTVVCILKEQTNESIQAKGIAKCNPSDVFNKHIGKAIALGRALGLDVTKFEQAVQPNEPVIGMKFIDRHSDVREIVEEGIYDKESMKSSIGSPNVEEYPIQIINDTNAQYGGVE